MGESRTCAALGLRWGGPWAGWRQAGAGPQSGARRWAPSVCLPKAGARRAESQSDFPGRREFADWEGSSEEPGPPGGKAGGVVI